MNPLISTPLTLLLIHRAHTRGSLTPPAILAATITALIHASHPTALPFTLLLTFYLLGTSATKLKAKEKELLTLRCDGGAGHAAPAVPIAHTSRGVKQVLANSVISSILCLFDLLLRKKGTEVFGLPTGIATGKGLFGGDTGLLGDILMVGIISNYASTTADTLSSELGILSPTPPRLILHPTRICPPGTNGGVSLTGLSAGLLGSMFISLVSILGWYRSSSGGSPPPAVPVTAIAYLTLIGLLGSIVDSVLGAVFQLSVVDVRTGKIVENPHGGRVLVVPGETSFNRGSAAVHQAGTGEKEEHGKVVEKVKVEGSRKVVQGSQRFAFLDNNSVNVLMAGVMAMVGMAGWWEMSKL